MNYREAEEVILKWQGEYAPASTIILLDQPTIRQTGYIVVPHGAGLREELEDRCVRTAKVPSEWVRVFKLGFFPN